MLVTTPVAHAAHTVQVGEAQVLHVPERASRRSYSAKYKLAILAEFEGLGREGKGALLRRAGFVHVPDYGSDLRRSEG